MTHLVPPAGDLCYNIYIDTPNSKTFELMGLHLRNGSHSTRLIVVYRPPPNTKN